MAPNKSPGVSITVRENEKTVNSLDRRVPVRAKTSTALVYTVYAQERQAVIPILEDRPKLG